MLLLCFVIKLVLLSQDASGYWDIGTTTLKYEPYPWRQPQQSFFRWMRVESTDKQGIAGWFSTVVIDWDKMELRRMLYAIAGVSIDMLPITTAVILNRRTLITSANPLDPHIHRQRDLRIWALGRDGFHDTPYRYRVWKVERIFPKSLNPEHCHGPRGTHSPRHDVAIIHTLDQMYIYFIPPTRYHYPYKAFLAKKRQFFLPETLIIVGSGYEDMIHVTENFKIYYDIAKRADVVDCSIYLPKWWGKFICIKNVESFAGIQSGGGLFANKFLIGIGCFEIRYNEDRILVFTDLRYYVDHIILAANITPGEYYEYAYPEWSVLLNWIYDGHGAAPVWPPHQIVDDLYPLGRK